LRTRIKALSRIASPRTCIVVLVALMMMMILPHGPDEVEAATWSSPYIVASGSVGQSMAMDVDGDWIYCVYLQDIRGIWSIVMRYYNGTAWSSVVTVSDRLSTVVADPAVSASNGVAHIVYMDRSDGDQDVMYRSFNGTDLSQIFQVSSGATGANDFNPDVATDGSYVHIVWESVTATDRDILYRNVYAGRMSMIFTVSTDTNNEVQAEPAVAAGNGKAHVVWQDPKPGDRNIFYRQWNSGVWQTERDLIGYNDRVSQTNPDVACYGDDVYIVYQDYSQPMTPDLDAVFYLGGRWGTPTSVPTPSGAEYDPLIDAEAGHVALVYTNTVSTALAYFQHFDGQSWGTPHIIERPITDHFYYSTSIALLQGRAHMTIFDREDIILVHKYYSVDLDEAEPSAEVGELDPYWISGGRISLPYNASDDYCLDRVTVQYRYSADNETWDRWTAVSTLTNLTGMTATGAVSFLPSDGDGFYEFKAYAVDYTGKSEAPTTEPEAMMGLDTMDPRGSIVINGGDNYTASAAVTLTLTGTDVTSGVAKVRFGEDAIGGDEPWEDPVDTKRWTLTATEGERTVAYQVMDLAGRLSPVYTDTIYLDLTDPHGTIATTVAGEWTTTREVDLELTSGDTGSGVAGIRFGDEAIGGDEPWEDPVDTKQWTLPVGDGTHTIAYQVLDAAGRTSEAYTVSVDLDTTPPTGSIIIGGLDSYTSDRTVNLLLTAEDATSGVAGIRVSNEAIGGDEPWDDKVDLLEWQLTEGSGLKTVYYQVLDVAGLTSQVYTATITLDQDVPTASIALASGALVVNTATVTLSLSFDDATSDVVGIRVQEEAIGGDEPWEDPVESMEFQLSAGDGEKTIRLQVVDAAGHESQVYSVSFTLDTTNPLVDLTEPDDLAEKVPVDRAITVRFSEAMDTATAEAAFSLSYEKDGAANEVPGTFTWSSDGKTMTFTPAEALSKGTTYTITISTDATDAVGNGLFPALSRQFTTAGSSGDGGGGGGGSSALLIAVVVVIAIVAVALIFVLRARGGAAP